MTVIRFNDEIFTTDSSEYDILVEAAAAVKGVDGAILEIGSRRGGSAKMIIDMLAANSDTNRSMFCVDPYGNIDYPTTNLTATLHNIKQLDEDQNSTDKSINIKLDYTNQMRNEIIPSLYFYAYRNGLNFSFFCMEDTEFFKRFADGVPVYNDYKKIENSYALVFFDGPHTNEIVREETDFFLTRTSIGSHFVYDDIWMYDHQAIEDYILANGFETVRRGNIKASYVRTR